MKKIIGAIGKYLREVSVVVIGVAVTLYAGHRIGLSNEKRDVALYLHAIRLEAEENIAILDGAIVNLKTEVAYTDYLRSNRGNVDRDSIAKHARIAYMIQYHTFKTNAFEMFKGSGGMRLMEDKELLLSLWEVYDGINQLKIAIDMIHALKKEYVQKELDRILSKHKEFVVPQVPMHNFFILDMYRSLLVPYERLSEKLEELIERLDELKKPG